MLGFFKKKKNIPQENKPIIDEDFNDIIPIAKYFHNETGITFDTQISILKNKVIAFCRHREIYSFYTLLSKVKSDKNIKQELIDHLTTNETFFYREFGQIEELVQLVKNSSKRVKILCAPCATGEEPYSIAIALLEAGVPYNHINITGIDINADAVKKAQTAIYKQRNVRNLSNKMIGKYFTQDGDKYLLNSDVKSLVSFKVMNIFDNSFKALGKFDFIFCRNMLIYFNKETKLKAKKILEAMRTNTEHEVFFGHADLF